MPPQNADQPSNVLNWLWPSVLTGLLRGSSLLSRVALWAALVRVFNNSELGQYGLLAATAQLAIICFGFEYYLFTTREIPTAPPPIRAGLIREQALLHVLAYIVAAVALLSLAATGQITWTLGAWLATLLPAEHFSHELYRLLVALGRPTAANVVLFLRTATWALAVSAAVFLVGIPIELNDVLVSWLLAVVVSIAVGVLMILPAVRGPAARVSVERVLRGIKTALPFTISAFAIIGANHAARYILLVSRGAAETGVYSFYMSMALTVETIIHATTINHVLPHLVRASNTRDSVAWNATLRRLTVGTTAGVIALGLVLAGGVPVALIALKRTDLLAQVTSFHIMLFGVNVSALSLIWHYVLYAHRRDKSILLIHLGWLVVAAAGYIAFVPYYGVRGAAITYAVTACFAGVARFTLARRSDPLLA